METPALLNAVSQGNLHEVQNLVNNPQTDINVSDGGGCAFFRAVRINRPDILRVLLSRQEANPNGLGNSWSPLKTAVFLGNQECINILLADQRVKRTIDNWGLSKSTPIPEGVTASGDYGEE